MTRYRKACAETPTTLEVLEPRRLLSAGATLVDPAPAPAEVQPAVNLCFQRWQCAADGTAVALWQLSPGGWAELPRAYIQEPGGATTYGAGDPTPPPPDQSSCSFRFTCPEEDETVILGDVFGVRWECEGDEWIQIEVAPEDDLDSTRFLYQGWSQENPPYYIWSTGTENVHRPGRYKFINVSNDCSPNVVSPGTLTITNPYELQFLNPDANGDVVEAGEDMTIVFGGFDWTEMRLWGRNQDGSEIETEIEFSYYGGRATWTNTADFEPGTYRLVLRATSQYGYDYTRLSPGCVEIVEAGSDLPQLDAGSLPQYMPDVFAVGPGITRIQDLPKVQPLFLTGETAAAAIDELGVQERGRYGIIIIDHACLDGIIEINHAHPDRIIEVDHSLLDGIIDINHLGLEGIIDIDNAASKSIRGVVGCHDPLSDGIITIDSGSLAGFLLMSSQTWEGVMDPLA